ncbi:hypothetical protein OAT67_01095 [Bacteriovoracaceae bacterium]|nr:hypothetical protein [Bacteriovoracaceae bacterium]
MKKIFILMTAILTLLSTNTFANIDDVFGGVVKSGKEKLYVVCTEYNQETCVAFDINVDSGNDFYTLTSLYQVNPADLSKEARDASNDRLKDTYRTIGAIGMLPGFALIWTGNGLGVPVFAAGVVVDVVKAPIVFVGYLAHSILDLGGKRRIKKLFNHLFDQDAKGKTKRTRRRYFKSMKETAYAIQGILREVHSET